MKASAHFAFYRTLYSQSAASLTVSTAAGSVRALGWDARLTLLSKGDHLTASLLATSASSPDITEVLFLKVNFQDAAESLPLANEIAQMGWYRWVVLLGIYPAGNYEAILHRYPFINGIIVGEPESIAPSVLANLENGSPLDLVPGVATVQGDTVKILPTHTLNSVVSLDDVRPVRDIELSEPSRLANVESNRGCIAACTFCHVPVVEQRFGAPRRRLRSIERVVEDVQQLADMGKRYIIFNDPVFWGGSGDTERVVELAERLAEIRPRIYFMAYLRLAPFPDNSLLETLARCGLIRTFIGVESDSDDTLKLYRKGATGQGYSVVKSQLDRHGISHHIGFLTFNPYSTLAQIRRDLEFLRVHDQLHRIGVVLERTRLVPGTSLGAKAESEGLCTGERDPLSCDAAYSWVFADRNVGALHQYLHKTLSHDFSGRGKYLEYYHTSAGLLRFMIEREDNLDFDTGVIWRPLDLCRSELAELLHDFYTQAIDAAAQSALPVESDRVFLAQLNRLSARTQVAYADLMSTVRNMGHGEIIEAMYTSREGY